MWVLCDAGCRQIMLQRRARSKAHFQKVSGTTDRHAVMFSQLLKGSSYIWDFLGLQLVGTPSTCADLFLEGDIWGVSLWVRMCVPPDHCMEDAPPSDHTLTVKVDHCVKAGHKCLSWSPSFHIPPCTVWSSQNRVKVNPVCSSALHQLFYLHRCFVLRCCKAHSDTARNAFSVALTSSECSVVNLSPPNLKDLKA